VSTGDPELTDNDFRQQSWDADLADDCRHLIRLAIREDLDRWQDWTTLALIPEGASGAAEMMARQDGVVAGLAAVPLILEEMQASLEWQPLQPDGAHVTAGATIGRLRGSLRDMLVAERPLLNLVGRLSGIATVTRQYVERIAGTGARVYDTRKTIPGWRRLEKFAVHCGGGRNHRTGLFDGVLIKDNHLAFAGLADHPGAAVEKARQCLAELRPHYPHLGQLMVEVEVDTLKQFQDALLASPDIILLDNMSLDELREAVRRRNDSRKKTELEASGGITLETIRAVAETGVERISVGALTHSAINLDVALDMRDGESS
jgi:nicotinate-nucleotide pyrophosphorylase (carboxylating)